MALLALVAGAVGVLSSWRTQEGPVEDLESTRATLEQWVQTRRVLSQEKRDWALGREMLQERIELVQREIETLRTRTAEARASIAEADTKRADLVAENDRLKEASAALRDRVATLEARTKELLVRLPDPIRDRIKPLSQRLPQDPADTKLSLGERFQNLVGILNETNKFNRDVTVTSEVRTLADGTAAEVSVVYLGLGQAFYVSGDGRHAGVGNASETLWTWTPANESARAIAEVLAILNNEDVAAFVQVPVRID